MSDMSPLKKDTPGECNVPDKPPLGKGYRMIEQHQAEHRPIPCVYLPGLGNETKTARKVLHSKKQYIPSESCATLPYGN